MEGRVTAFGLESNSMKAAAPEMAYGTLDGARPRRENPKSGTEMK